MGRKLNSCVAAALLACGLTSGICLGQDAVLEELYGRGVHAFFNQNYGEAFTALNAAVQGGSRDPRVFYFRGMVLEKFGRPDEARDDIRHAMELELTGGEGYAVGRALERIQGPERIALEAQRRSARVAMHNTLKAQERVRYQEAKQGENASLRGGGQAGSAARPSAGGVDATDPFAPRVSAPASPPASAPKAPAMPPPAVAPPAVAPPADAPPAVPAPSAADPFAAPPSPAAGAAPAAPAAPASVPAPPVADPFATPPATPAPVAPTVPAPVAPAVPEAPTAPSPAPAAPPPPDDPFATPPAPAPAAPAPAAPVPAAPVPAAPIPAAPVPAAPAPAPASDDPFATPPAPAPAPAPPPAAP